jgi:hypothetical protein
LLVTDILLGFILAGIGALLVMVGLGFSGVDYMMGRLLKRGEQHDEEMTGRHVTLRLDLGLPTYSRYCIYCYQPWGSPHSPGCRFSYETHLAQWRGLHPEDAPITKEEFYANQAHRG